MKLFVDNLTNVDVSYLDAQRGLVGESWLTGIMLDGSLDKQSMICDFGVVKRNAKKWLDDYIDHRLVVPTKMPGLSIDKHDKLTTVKCPHPTGGEFICSAPHEAFCFIECATIDNQSVAQWLSQQLTSIIPGEIAELKISLHNELIGGAFYHYSHGLKKHDGNCQRIAHGHRSKIEIFIDGARQPELEKDWAKKWHDIYVGTLEDLHNTTTLHSIEHNHYRYQAPQGDFSLTLPASACYNMDSDTTVEQIAKHIAKTLLESGHSVTVKAFEGVGKGAIAEYEQKTD
ncbi:6-carboxytetrahydropterin synthase [Bermanella sp. R86510]|uniref:6-carboxytetrahydropterin synthase n=1 Tax=unclassified Bermanella TaxID=2627862 RepID=UPI0037C6AF0E